MILDQEFLFIIGSPRSGTTWLQAMIGAHPRVCTTVELTLFSEYTAPWINRWEREAANIAQGRWHQGLPFLWTEDEFYDFLKGFLDKVYERVISTNPQATHVLDKHPGYSLYVEHIHRLVPNARFIHLIRDGRDVAVSMVAARRRVGFGTDTIAASAAEWKRTVRAAWEASQYQGRYLEVRYEDLLTAGVDVLKSVFEFCGLSAAADEVTAIFEAHQFQKMKAARMTPARSVKAPEGAYWRGSVGNWQGELDPMQRYSFDRIAGDLLRELGYAQEGWWADSEGQKTTLPITAAISTALQRVRHAVAVIMGPTLTGCIKETKTVRLVRGKGGQ